MLQPYCPAEDLWSECPELQTTLAGKPPEVVMIAPRGKSDRAKVIYQIYVGINL